MVRGHSRFLWIGNHPALDFVNTLPKVDGSSRELLATAADLVDWLREGHLLEPAPARAASGLVTPPREAESVATRARALREVLRRGIESVVRGRALGDPPVAALNEILRSSAGTTEV